MAGNHEAAELLSVDCRKVRDIGNGVIGQSFDRDALRELGLVDEDGELVEDVSARQKITADGQIVIDIPDHAAD